MADPLPPPRVAERRTASDEQAHAPLFVLLGAYLLYFLRFGYDYAASDQDELLPFLLHRLDPSLFANDWFVQLQATGFNIRLYPVLTLEAFARLLTAGPAVLLLYVATWLLLAAAVYAVACHLTRSRLAAAAVVVAALVFTPQWTLGGNDLVHRMLVPSMAGWCLGLWGFYFGMRGHPGRAGLLLGGATCFQALVGLQLAGLLGAALAFDWLAASRRRSEGLPLLRFAGFYTLFAAPALVPIFLQQLTPAALPPAADLLPARFYMLAHFRNPHHYLFHAFPPRTLARFGLLVGFGLTALLALPRRPVPLHRGFVLRLLALIGCLLVAAYLFTEVFPSLFVAQLQLFKLTVFAKLLLLTVLCHAGLLLLPERFRAALDRLLQHRQRLLGLILLGGLLTIGALRLGFEPLRARLYPLVHQQSPLGQVERWVRSHTPPDAVFAVPPSMTTFRSQARRAIVVNFKAVPYETAATYAWFERLTALAPVALPETGSPALQEALDDAFEQHTAQDLLRLARRYGFTYVLRRTPLHSLPTSITPVLDRDGWFLYRLAPGEPDTR